MSLKENSLLITLNISQWVGRKLDTHKTDAKVGNYNKRLLPGAHELEEIQAHASSLRKFYYENTLPWAHDGARIISSQNYVNFTSEFRARKQAFYSSVGKFLAEYPRLRDQAKIKLGDLFSDSEYPTDDKLLRKFSCEISVFPIPDVNDFRVELGDAEKKLFLESMARVESQALTECYSRLFEVVKTAADRLQKPDAIFRDSLIGNITELVALLPRLNPIHDPKLEALRLEVNSVIGKVSAESIRGNEATREMTAQKLGEIAERMGAFMEVENENA
jgi:hypothetical protein